MADAIDVVAGVLALVQERDEALEMRDVSQRQADAALAAKHEAARQMEMLRAERDKAIEERDLARRGFDARRECESSALRERNEAREERDVLRAKLDEAQTALKVLREWNDFERSHPCWPAAAAAVLRGEPKADAEPFNPTPTPGALWSGREIFGDMIEVLDRPDCKDHVAVAIEWIDGRTAATITQHAALELAGAIRRRFGLNDSALFRAAANAVNRDEIVRAERERVRSLAAHVTSPEDAVSFVEDLKRGDL